MQNDDAGRGLGPYELDTIVTGDARELAKAIPNESIDLIFTDPIYDRQGDYLWLSSFASYALRKGGSLLVWSNGKWQYQNTKWLDAGTLKYQWTFDVVTTTQSAPMDGKIIAKTNRVIWFTRGDERNMRDYLPDGYGTVGGQWSGMASGWNWGKSATYTIMCLRCFSDTGDIVFDPFAGLATTAAACKIADRRCLSFEIDAAVAERARERVRNTQPPLFVPDAVQLTLDAAGDIEYTE